VIESNFVLFFYGANYTARIRGNSLSFLDYGRTCPPKKVRPSIPSWEGREGQPVDLLMRTYPHMRIVLFVCSGSGRRSPS